MPRILVVDDDAHIRQALVDRFTARKFDVRSAGSGKDALSKIVHEQPDVVLLDLQLPEGDGFWVLKELREEGIEATVVRCSQAHRQFHRPRAEPARPFARC